MVLSVRRSNKRPRGRLAAAALASTVALTLAVPGTAFGAQSPTAANAAGMKVASGVKLDKKLQTLLPVKLRKAGTLVIGAQLQQAPDDYYAADGKTAVGFEVDLAKALGNTLGLKISYQPMAFDSLITGLQDNRVDITMSAMNDTAAREKSVNFVDYLVDGIGFLVQAGNPDHITGPMSFCGKSVTVVAGTTQQAYAAQLSNQCKAKGKKPVTVVVGSSTAQEDESLTTGRVAAVFNDNITDAYDVQTQPKLFAAINYPPIEPGPYGIGVNKHDGQLLNAVHQGLQHLMAIGAYKKILAAWDLSSVAIPKATVNDSKLS